MMSGGCFDFHCAMSEFGIIGGTSDSSGGEQESEVDHGEADSVQLVCVGTFGASYFSET
jgi:hypothetical protein